MASFPTNILTKLNNSQADVICLSVCSILPSCLRVNFLLNFLVSILITENSSLKENLTKILMKTQRQTETGLHHYFSHQIHVLGTFYCLLVTQMERIFCTTAWNCKVERYTEQADCPLENAHLAFPFCCVNNSQLPSESLGIIIMNRIIYKTMMI